MRNCLFCINNGRNYFTDQKLHTKGPSVNSNAGIHFITCLFCISEIARNFDVIKNNSQTVTRTKSNKRKK